MEEPTVRYEFKSAVEEELQVGKIDLAMQLKEICCFGLQSVLEVKGNNSKVSTGEQRMRAL